MCSGLYEVGLLSSLGSEPLSLSPLTYPQAVAGSRRISAGACAPKAHSLPVSARLQPRLQRLTDHRPVLDAPVPSHLPSNVDLGCADRNFPQLQCLAGAVNSLPQHSNSTITSRFSPTFHTSPLSRKLHACISCLTSNPLYVDQPLPSSLRDAPIIPLTPLV